MEAVSGTLVVMVSVGNRTHISDYTFPRLANWAARHGYSVILIKKPMTRNGIAPHFNKLIAHRLAPGFGRYIIVDDDLILKKHAPPMEAVPPGIVDLCADVVQSNTEATHVTWTGNTGFIVSDRDGLLLLEEAFHDGEYPFNQEMEATKRYTQCLLLTYDHGSLSEIFY